MTTLAVPHSPTPSRNSVHTAGQPRYVAVRANLLPEELIASRQTGTLKRRLIAALTVLLVALGAWYGFSRWATISAQHDLTKAQQQNAKLAAEQQKYQKVVQTQQAAAAINSALAKLMVGDLSWKDMLTTLRANARNGVALFSVSAHHAIRRRGRRQRLDRSGSRRPQPERRAGGGHADHRRHRARQERGRRATSTPSARSRASPPRSRRTSRRSAPGSASPSA